MKNSSWELTRPSEARLRNWNLTRASARLRRRVFLSGQPSDVESYAERVRSLTKEAIRAVIGQYLSGISGAWE